jgi:hypothetical protein
LGDKQFIHFDRRSPDIQRRFTAAQFVLGPEQIGPRHQNPHSDRRTHKMNTHVGRRIGRYVALPVVAAGIIGGAALGLAGMANAASGTWSYDPQPRPGIVAEPHTKAKPPAEAYPGRWWHRHHPSLLDPSTAWDLMGR